jgi:hypothetical protein
MKKQWTQIWDDTMGNQDSDDDVLEIHGWTKSWAEDGSYVNYDTMEWSATAPWAYIVKRKTRDPVQQQQQQQEQQQQQQEQQQWQQWQQQQEQQQWQWQQQQWQQQKQLQLQQQQQQQEQQQWQQQQKQQQQQQLQQQQQQQQEQQQLQQQRQQQQQLQQQQQQLQQQQAQQQLQEQQQQMQQLPPPVPMVTSSVTTLALIPRSPQVIRPLQPMTEQCRLLHAEFAYDGTPWLSSQNVACTITDHNKIDPRDLEGAWNPWGSSLDASLFYGNKIGWDKCWKTMAHFRDYFNWTKMSTGGRFKGCSAECKYCNRTVVISWTNAGSYKTSEEELSAARARWLGFFNCEFTDPTRANLATPIR